MSSTVACMYLAVGEGDKSFLDRASSSAQNNEYSEVSRHALMDTERTCCGDAKKRAGALGNHEHDPALETVAMFIGQWRAILLRQGPLCADRSRAGAETCT